MTYAKILLNQSNLSAFQKYILPEISDKSFSFQANGRELLNVYYLMNKEYNLIKINDINFSEVPNSLKTRLKSLYQEAQILQKHTN